MIAQALAEADALSGYGDRLMSAGAFSNALPVLKAALGLRLMVAGPEHLDTAAAANSVAVVHQRMGHFEEASVLFEKALVIYRAALGPEHPDTAAALGNLATLYSSMERYTEALPLLQQALDITRNALGAGHPEAATLMHNLGLVYGATGHCDEGLPLLEQALHERHLVPSTPAVPLPSRFLASCIWPWATMLAPCATSRRQLRSALRSSAPGTHKPPPRWPL